MGRSQSMQEADVPSGYYKRERALSRQHTGESGGEGAAEGESK